MTSLKAHPNVQANLHTYDEVVAWLDALPATTPEQGAAPRRWVIEAVVFFLPFEYAKKYLASPGTAQAWTATEEPYTVANVLSYVEVYMVHAWTWGLQHKGELVAKARIKFAAWMWLVGCEDMQAIFQQPTSDYGMSDLKLLCAEFGFELPVSG